MVNLMQTCCRGSWDLDKPTLVRKGKKALEIHSCVISVFTEYMHFSFTPATVSATPKTLATPSKSPGHLLAHDSHMSTVQVSPSLRKFVLHFYKRPMLVPVPINKKKSEEDFQFLEKKRNVKIAFSFGFASELSPYRSSRSRNGACGAT